jgi:hypothetical protein
VKFTCNTVIQQPVNLPPKTIHGHFHTKKKKSTESGDKSGSPCIVPAARGKKLIAAGRRQNIGAARKKERKKRKKEKKKRGKEEKFAKKILGGCAPDPALDKKRRTPCGLSAAAKK